MQNLCVISLFNVCFKLQVINAYIYYLRSQEHLLNRAGGNVWLDSTHVSGILKRDATVPISPEEHQRIVERALNYLQHDMVRLRTKLREYNLIYYFSFTECGYNLHFYVSSSSQLT